MSTLSVLANKVAPLIQLNGVQRVEELTDDLIRQAVQAITDDGVKKEAAALLPDDQAKLTEQLRGILELRIRAQAAGHEEAEVRADGVDTPAAEEVIPEQRPPVAEQPQPTVPQEDGGIWKNWGTIIMGAIGILSWIGALFTSEEGTKGKSIFAGIGGLLLGGAVLTQWPSIAKLFGKSSDEAVQASRPADVVAQQS